MPTRMNGALHDPSRDVAQGEGFVLPFQVGKHDGRRCVMIRQLEDAQTKRRRRDR